MGSDVTDECYINTSLGVDFYLFFTTAVKVMRKGFRPDVRRRKPNENSYYS